MAIRIDMVPVAEIESAVIHLAAKEFLRSGRSYNDTVTELSNISARAKKDESILVASRLNMRVVDVLDACLEKLIDVHAKRIGLLGGKADIVEIFDERMPRMKSTKKVLMNCMMFLISVLNDNYLKRTYREVKKGYGDIDTLDDIVVCSTTIDEHPETYALVAPGGIEITAEYLAKVRADAKDMISMHGEAAVATDGSKELLDRQRRLMTLCVMAERWIKLYAKMAFMNKMDHYDEYYASPSMRAANRVGANQEDDDIDVDNVIDEIADMEASAMEENNIED